MILLNSCAGNVNAEVLQKLKTDYPDAKITRSGNLLEVISQNVDVSQAEKTECGISDGHYYASAQILLDSMDPVTDIIFIGEKNGRNKAVHSR